MIADLPASSGLGSSSAFTVCSAEADRRASVAFADQFGSGPPGGLRRAVPARGKCWGAGSAPLYLRGAQPVRVRSQAHANHPVQMSAPCLAAVPIRCFCCTQASRTATRVENSRRTNDQDPLGDRRRGAVSPAHSYRSRRGCARVSDPERMLIDFGAMLHEGWETKKRLSSRISSPAIDDRYAAARSAGALGGKLCGAGSGGFLLLLVPPDHQMRFLQFRGRGCAQGGHGRDRFDCDRSVRCLDTCGAPATQSSRQGAIYPESLRKSGKNACIRVLAGFG